MAVDYGTNPAIANFIEYLKIPSVQPNINYDDCVSFLKKQANGLDLLFKIYELVPRKPIVVLTWLGKEPSLPSILLNSHMDVVPVFENSWTYPPFSGHIDDDGKIFARGSQDMKCVGIQYLETIRKLQQSGIHLKRTLHVCFVPDEEIGGHDGMEKFVHTQEFKELNIGFALDEGMACPTDEFIIFNGERSIWQIHVHCTGQPGHGSLLIPNTAGEKLRYIIDKFMDLREEQKKILESNPKLTIGDVTTVNWTQTYGGVQSNVVPEKLTAVFDIRLAVTVDHTEFQAKINRWCKEAGEGVTIEFEQKNVPVECTKVDGTNPFWVAFKGAADELKLKLDIRIFPGGTDSRYVRQVSRDDGLPELMCSNCVYKLGIAFHFKQTCESADVRLRQYLGLQLPIKSTDASVMTDPIAPIRTTIIKKCKCKNSQPKRSSTNYKRKPESEKLKRGPKPKPKQIHSCFECHKQFRCQAQLEMHVRTHTGDKPFVCMLCPRRFTQKHNLTIHMRVHTGEKPFQCDVCRKSFSAQSNLQAHVKIHTGQRDHVCVVCNKSFITSSELTRHMSKHRQVKSFKCEICGTGYVHSRNLKLHKQKKHSIGPAHQNNSGNIDIIGIDVGKETVPMKDVNHLIPQLLSDKHIPAPTHPFNEKPNPLLYCQSGNTLNT